MKAKIEAMAKVMEIVIGEAVAKTAQDAGMTVKAVKYAINTNSKALKPKLMSRINEYVAIGLESALQTLKEVA